jgi:hypothetical protein
MCLHARDARPQESETFGAEANPTGDPIGGGAGYRKVVTAGEYKAATKEELLDALKKAKAGQTIFVDGAAEIDLSGQKGIVIPGGVTLASNRGQEGAPGASLFTKDAVSPLFAVGGDNVRVTGLRIRGPSPERDAKLNLSNGIACTHAQLEVDNCEISGWAYAGVLLSGGAAKAHIHHNNIHHCQRPGYGYGVSLDKGDALIEANILDWCRHCIAGSGVPGSAYEARYNIVVNSTEHAFDMHGAYDRKNGMPGDAGESVSIHHNTFKGPLVAIWMRGCSAKESVIHHNRFLQHAYEEAAVRQDNAMGNMRVYQNFYGKAASADAKAQEVRDRISELVAKAPWKPKDAAAAAAIGLIQELMAANVSERQLPAVLNVFRAAYFESTPGVVYLWGPTHEYEPYSAYEPLLALARTLKPQGEAQKKALDAWLGTQMAEMKLAMDRAAKNAQTIQVDRGTFRRDWLLLGPFFGAGPDSAVGGWDKVGPKAGATSPDYKATFNSRGQTLAWEQRCFSTDPGVAYVDLMTKGLKPTPYNFMWVYAAGEIEAAQDSDVIFWIGSDDDRTVWLDGKQIHTTSNWRLAVPDEDKVPVRLTAGVHSVVLKITQYWGIWGFYFRIGNADGKGDPKGVTFRCPAKK